MKTLLLMMALLVGSTGCAEAKDNFNNNANNSNDGEDMKDKKILVVYYSWSGNTETVARTIQAETGADIFEIQLTEPFSTDYNTVAQQYREDNRTGTNRKLKNTVENLSEYDIIILGAPIWGGTRALPVKSFLLEHNLSGKTVAPFTTHGGGGAGSCFSDMKREAPQATFTDGLSLSSGQSHNSQAAVERWLKNIDIIE